MLLETGAVRDERSAETCKAARTTWGASSEVGRLTDVLLSAPPYLTILPCNQAALDSLAKGLFTSTSRAARQHRAFGSALEGAGVRCHFVEPHENMPDLCFTRDAAVMSPWGLIELRPAAAHRRAEPPHVATAMRGIGVPIYDRVEHGTVEGGDVCLVREGLVAIGISGDRTDEAGARALGTMFERNGWEVLRVRYDPHYLHLDTMLTMIDESHAVACAAALGADVVADLQRQGLSLVSASADEVARLGANLLSLGDRRIVAPRATGRLNALLAGRGFEVIEVEIDEFTRCGGGPHCLTMPLARQPA